MLLIDQKIFKRAKRGIKNCPFNLFFFQNLLDKSLSANDVFTNKSKYMDEEFSFINRASYIENEFIILIKIGVLRREVDGQGLTSKVRITPIGRQVLESSTDLFNPKNTIISRLVKCITHQLQPM